MSWRAGLALRPLISLLSPEEKKITQLLLILHGHTSSSNSSHGHTCTSTHALHREPLMLKTLSNKITSIAIPKVPFAQRFWYSCTVHAAINFICHLS